MSQVDVTAAAKEAAVATKGWFRTLVESKPMTMTTTAWFIGVGFVPFAEMVFRHVSVSLH